MTNPYRIYKGKEDDFQMAVAERLDLMNIFWYHVANERKTNKLTGHYLKLKGVKPGVSDVTVMEPRGIYHGFVCELKTEGNKLSDKPYIWPDHDTFIW